MYLPDKSLSKTQFLGNGVLQCAVLRLESDVVVVVVVVGRGAHRRNRAPARLSGNSKPRATASWTQSAISSSIVPREVDKGLIGNGR